MVGELIYNSVTSTPRCIFKNLKQTKGLIFLVALGAVIHFIYNMPSWIVVILTYFLKGQEQATEKKLTGGYTFPPNHYHPSGASLFQWGMILQYVAK